MEFLNFIGRKFQGWRQRIGLVILAMALGTFGLFAGSIQVGYVIGGEHGVDMIATSNYGLMWARSWFPEVSSESPSRYSAGWNFHYGPQLRQFGPETESHWQCCGFHIAHGQRFGLPESIFVIPYWVIVLPLTLVSAYLLLVKPRSPKSTKNGKDDSSSHFMQLKIADDHSHQLVAEHKVPVSDFQQAVRQGLLSSPLKKGADPLEGLGSKLKNGCPERVRPGQTPFSTVGLLDTVC